MVLGFVHVCIYLSVCLLWYVPESPEDKLLWINYSGYTRQVRVCGAKRQQLQCNRVMCSLERS